MITAGENSGQYFSTFAQCWKLSIISFFFLLLCGIWSFPARDQIRTTAANQAEAEETPDL